MQTKLSSLFWGIRYGFCKGPIKIVNQNKFAGKLTILPTPIGNLHDLSPNIIKALFKADVIGCEDRRVAGKLYTLIKSKNIMQNLTDSFGQIGLNSLIPLAGQENTQKTQQQQNYLFYEYANMTQKARKKFIRKMTKQQQQKFKIDFLKYRALKIMQKQDDFLKKQKQDKFDELYGLDSSDLEHIEIQIRNTRMKKGRGVLIPLNTYSETKMFNMVRMFLQTKNVAIISDAGMPCISDPGWKMVRKIRQTHPEIPIEVIGGPSTVSLITMLASLSSQSGKNCLSGRFEGFAPEIHSQMSQKSVEIEQAKRKQFSIHFINSKKLRNKVIELEKNYGPDQGIFLANQLTKLYERKYNGTLGELNNLMSKQDNEFQGIGELSYLVYPKNAQRTNQEKVQNEQNQFESTSEQNIGEKIQQKKQNMPRISLISIKNFIDSIKDSEQQLKKTNQSPETTQNQTSDIKTEQNKSIKKQKGNQSQISSKDLIDLICSIFGIKTSEARKLVYQKQIAIKNKKLGKTKNVFDTAKAFEQQQKQKQAQLGSENSRQQKIASEPSRKVGRRAGRRRQEKMSQQEQELMKLFKNNQNANFF